MLSYSQLLNWFIVELFNCLIGELLNPLAAKPICALPVGFPYALALAKLPAFLGSGGFGRNCTSFNGLSFHHLLGPIRTIHVGSGSGGNARESRALLLTHAKFNVLG